MMWKKGYTLIELVVAMASASVLMVGLSAALFASSRALNVDEGATFQRNQSGETLSRVLSEIEEARGFSTLTTTLAEFTVPDRTGDGTEETIRYAWSGVPGDPLTRTLNGGTASVIMRDVSSLNFNALTQSVAATDVTAPPNPLAPVLSGLSLVRVDRESSLILPNPAGTADGELLLACVVIDSSRSADLVLPAGWNLLDVGEQDGRITMGVAWRITGAAEPASTTWDWNRSEAALAWVLRISNQGSDSPIGVAGGGSDASPTCPPVSVAGDNAMVVRFGGFDRGKVTPGDVGMPGQIPILMQVAGSGGGAASGGCAYTVQPVAGTAPAASFTLTGSDEGRTLTVVVPARGL